MKNGRMTLVENVEILSNVAQKTIGYTIIFRDKQHIISFEEIKELHSYGFIKNVLGDFQPIKGAVISLENYGLPSVHFSRESGVDFSTPLPAVTLKEDRPTKKSIVAWVQAFNKFLDEIDALNIENVETPTFKNIVLV